MMREVLVYADWEVLAQPVLVGVLRQSMVRNHEHFSFRKQAYDVAESRLCFGWMIYVNSRGSFPVSG